MCLLIAGAKSSFCNSSGDESFAVDQKSFSKDFLACNIDIFKLAKECQNLRGRVFLTKVMMTSSAPLASFYLVKTMSLILEDQRGSCWQNYAFRSYMHYIR